MIMSFGVIDGASLISSELGYSGLPFTMYVISDRNVLHSSSEKAWFLQVELRACLTDLIRVSTTPFW